MIHQRTTVLEDGNKNNIGPAMYLEFENDNQNYRLS